MRLLPIISVALVILSCSMKDGGTTESLQPAFPEPLTPKEGYPFMGVVSADGAPVEGAVVTDGVHVTKTDKSGRYFLQGTGNEHGTDFIILSVPPGYRLIPSSERVAPPHPLVPPGQKQ